MAKKQENVPRYGTTMRRGIQYYRTRITDADGKRVDLYAETCEELQLKEMEARRQVEEAVFRRKHPTVAEYCEKWLLMQSAKVSSGTLRGYTQTMNNYIVKPLGDMYLEDVTADDIRLAMIPLASKSAGLYYRTRITDADGKRVDLYAETCEELQLKEMEARRQVEEAVFRRKHPTVAEYCEKWLLMQSAKVSSGTLRGYTQTMNNYIVKPLGDMYLEDVTADDIRLAMIPLASKSAGLYSKVNMLLKCVFYSAERSQLLEYNPCEGLSAKGGKPGKKINTLTDEQVKLLLDTVRGLPPYTFIMIALYSGLRREEILGLQWDCVFLDVPTPYISVRRAWRSENNRPVISTTLKTKAARRDIPIPKCLTDCLREVKEKTESEYVVADRNGNPLSSSQFQRVWKYVTVRSTKPHNYYKYVNGQCVKCTVTPTPGSHQKNNPKLVYAIDFDVTPHQLRHTYITNLLYAGIDPKTVQYLAGHENSKTTMDIYAQVKYNKPEELLSVVNAAFAPSVGV